MTEIKSINSIFPDFIENEPVLETMRMNPVVKRILEKFPKACLGGSSVLYDVVLPLIEKNDKYFNSWNSRDFDIYCLDNDYLDIVSFLKTFSKVLFIRTISNIKKSSYANLDIISLREYNITFDGGQPVRKLQLVNIGKYSNYSTLYNSIDLSFCSVVISNNIIYYLKTTKSDILAKTGILLLDLNKCKCSSCMKKNNMRLNFKMTERVKKYVNRGFKVENVCSFCNNHMNTYEHVHCCLTGKLFSKHFDSLHCILYSQHNTNKLDTDKVNQLISYSHMYKMNSNVLLSIYTIFAYFKRIDLLHSFWEEIKRFVNGKTLMKCSEQLIKDGLYTGFRLVFEYFVLHYINSLEINERYEYIKSLMEITVKCNFIQCALLIQQHIPTIELNIYEDQLFSWTNRIVYEILFDLINDEDSSQSEIDSLIKSIPFVQKLSDDDQVRDDICPICKYDNCSIRMICGHSFCQNCIISDMLTTYTKLEKEMCPCCRTRFYFMTKKIVNV
jgi:hypothetical protein